MLYKVLWHRGGSICRLRACVCWTHCTFVQILALSVTSYVTLGRLNILCLSLYHKTVIIVVNIPYTHTIWFTELYIKHLESYSIYKLYLNISSLLSLLLILIKEGYNWYRIARFLRREFLWSFCSYYFFPIFIFEEIFQVFFFSAGNINL